MTLGLTHSIAVSVYWAWLTLVKLTITLFVGIGADWASNLSEGSLETVESCITDLTMLLFTVWSRGCSTLIANITGLARQTSVLLKVTVGTWTTRNAAALLVPVVGNTGAELTGWTLSR